MLVASEEAEDRWATVLDFVARVSDPLHLSGWSLGVRLDDELHTFNRGFDSDVSTRYAVLALEVDLPGPVTARTGRSQYFRTTAEAHLAYPLAHGIDRDSGHRAAAALALVQHGWSVGYLALHFRAPQSFTDHERERLERLAASVASVMPSRPESAPTGGAALPGPS